MNKKFNIFFLFLFLIFSYSHNLFSHNILILNSYHRYAAWIDNICNKIVKEFPNDRFFVEYMDTKRFDRGKIFKIFYPYLSEKYKNVKIDLIVVTDNNALDFIVKYHNRLFDKIPVVFCGVNNFKKSMLKGDDYITGVVEKPYFKDTIKLILKLQSNINKIVVITGASYTSQLLVKYFMSLQKVFSDKIKIEILNGKYLNLDEIAAYLEQLKKSVLFFTSFYKTRDGKVFTINKAINFINKHTDLPIYTCWDIMMHYKNIVGGKITSSELQGDYVAKLIYQILKTGVPVKSLPVIVNSPTEYMFNYYALKKFNIDFKNLPPHSKILGKPSKEKVTIERQKNYLAKLIPSIIGLVIIVILLIINYFKRRKAEKKIGELLSEYKTLVNFSTDRVCVKDGAGRWLLTNEANVRLFSLENVDYIGKTDRELAEFSEFFRDAFIECEKSDKMAWQNRGIIRTEEIIPQPNGKSKIFDIIKIPIFGKKGERKRLIVIGRDITGIKEMHEQMIHFQKMDLMGNLAAGIAHDFNNILTGLSMNADMILMFADSDNENIKKYADNILKNIENAKHLVNKIKMTARKEKKNLSINNIIEILKHTLLVVKPSLTPNIKIIKKYNDEDRAFVKCDFFEISQVFMNILINSIDAINSVENRDGEIIINLEKQTDSVLIKITDNGVGMRKDVLDKIFEPFFTTKEKFHKRGSGLGLAICKSIITEHNGKIYAVSELDRGAEFIIELPTVEPEQQPDEQISDSKDKDAVINEKLAGKTILLIEDEEHIINMEKELLESLGFKVYCTNNGKEGIEFLERRNDIDIVFVDWQMPVLNGEKTVLEIRKRDKDIPVFLVTGAIDDKILEFKNKGIVSNIIAKPFKMNTIIEKLNGCTV